MTGPSAFAALHTAPDPFLPPNTWDLASGLLLTDAGFPAVGTTSLGVTGWSSTMTPTPRWVSNRIAWPPPRLTDRLTSDRSRALTGLSGRGAVVPAATERLLEAATRLFYERGIAASGVDTVVAESGVSKPTLYAHFGTKDALVAAVLARQHEQRRASLEAYLQARAGLPARERLLSLFDWVAGHQRTLWARGCPFVNAAVELVRPADDAARDVIQRHKRWFRGVLAELAAQAGAHDPAGLASQLHLLIEGANARMLAEVDTAAITEARHLAELALQARLP